MAKKDKPQRKPAQKDMKVRQLLGYHTAGWLTTKRETPMSGSEAVIVFLGKDATIEEAAKNAKRTLAPWQFENFKQQKSKEVFFASTPEGPTWFIRPLFPAAKSHHGLLQAAPFTKARDLCGSVFANEELRTAKSLRVCFCKADDKERLGALTGLEIASYSYKMPNGDKLPVFLKNDQDLETLEHASVLGVATNVARHLTNLPPNLLNPASYADAVKQYFSGHKLIEVDVWNHERLRREGMGLLLAVGAAASEQPRLVHIRYRGHQKSLPFAVVGKGITFDSGGLDIKPAAGMRYMKKDMGGSAALVGFAHWLAEAKPDINCDIYLALAENAISAQAFHPGDIIKSRQGSTVEIHNTDAEGRLVLADAIDVAVKQEGKHAPDCLINLATLTGAMRVAVGTELFGMFSNDDALADEVLQAARMRGDRGWRMPLVREYEGELKSFCADIANASPSGFGGSITAALFLERFVGSKPWVHLDMHAWTDRPVGPYTEPGGNGQGVMTLVGYAQHRMYKKNALAR